MSTDKVQVCVGMCVCEHGCVCGRAPDLSAHNVDYLIPLISIIFTPHAPVI